METLRTARFIAPLCALLALGGCHAQGREASPSGFLSGYEALEEAPGERGVLRYEKPGALAAYERFYIQPVRVHLRPGADVQRVREEDLDALARQFTADLRDALAEEYEVLDAPAPGALVIRAAITDVEPGTPALNIHPATKVMGLGLGGASFEAEGVDASTGERVFAVLVSRAAAKRFGSGLGELSDARQIMRDWTQQFRRRIDAAHGRTVRSPSRITQ